MLDCEAERLVREKGFLLVSRRSLTSLLCPRRASKQLFEFASGSGSVNIPAPNSSALSLESDISKLHAAGAWRFRRRLSRLGVRENAIAQGVYCAGGLNRTLVFRPVVGRGVSGKGRSRWIAPWPDQADAR